MDVTSKLDAALSSMIGDGGSNVLGLGAIVFKEGEEIYGGFFGRRHIAPDKPVERNTRFRIASVSKIFTMIGVMQAVERGLIDLDVDVSRYLGFRLRNPHFPDEPITARMLASHTSTLRDGDRYSLPPDCSLEEFFLPEGAHFATVDKNYFEYCNLNYGVLGTMLERVSGERFDRYMKANVLEPLELRADYVVGNLDGKSYEALGALYRKNGAAWTAQVDDYEAQPAPETISIDGRCYNLKDYRVGSNATIFSPAGGLRISFEELSHFLRMILNGGVYKKRRLLRAESLEKMMMPQWIYDGANGDPYDVMFNYGLGVYGIEGDGRARLCRTRAVDLIGHGGEAYGLISGLYFERGTRNGAAFMINGTALPLEKATGAIGSHYIWEERVMEPVLDGGGNDWTD